MVVTPVNAAADTKLRATALRAASACNPLGIGDAQPMLSWRIAGPAGTMQTAYQIRAASDRAQLGTGKSYLWDSGRISEATSTGVRYGGAPLASRQRIHWQVRIWDAAGRASPWSEPASLETGLLTADDWRGDWHAA
jgi:alpha-L-rhamnosidase